MTAGNDGASLTDYREFLRSKSQLRGGSGFAPLWLPDCLKGFQRSLDDWAIRRGRAEVMADCGLGKSLMGLVFAENVVRHTNRPFLLLAPPAVAAQFVREGEKFGVECRKVKEGRFGPGINVTNYEQLHHYSPDDFGGAGGDEAGCVKDFQSRTRRRVTEFFRKLPYRLLATATPAPNDFTELGTSAEALGELGHMDMLARFFKNDDKTVFLHGTKYGDMTQKKWRFKAHAEGQFWRWVCSWARACRKPSDLGFPDDGYDLPPLELREHVVRAKSLPPGMLFEVAPATLAEQREEQRRTVPERCERAAELVTAHGEPAIVWCHLNDEADLCERLIPGAVQVKGADPEERREEAFAAFVAGQVRVLVSKPRIGGWGLNFQHCAHQTFFPSHSFEAYYQCVRRCWRFGQTRPVRVDIVTTDGAAGVKANLQRKGAQADRMFDALVRHMHDALRIDRSAALGGDVEVPSWL